MFTTNHAGHDAAFALRDAGVEIAAIVDAGPAGSATDAARGAGIDVRNGWAVAGTDGDPRLSAVHLVGPGGNASTVDADLLLVSGGWNPVVQLWRAIGGGLRYDEPRACFVPDGNGPRWLSVVGAAAGDGPHVRPVLVRAGRGLLAALRGHPARLRRSRDVLDAVEHDLRSVEHIKRATYIGTALDQGRTSGVLTAAIVNQALGAGPGAQGPTNARPPYLPVSFAALAGPDRGSPVRSGARDADPRLARRSRSGVRERGPVEAAVVLPVDPAEDLDDAGAARIARRARRASA